MYYTLDEHGEPVPTEDVLVWADFVERTPQSRVVAATTVGAVRVSTVFLGLDHNWSGHGKPILWETMVFTDGHGGDQWRYTSRADALAGHARVCADYLPPVSGDRQVSVKGL